MLTSLQSGKPRGSGAEAPLDASGGDRSAFALGGSLQHRFLDPRQLGGGLLRPRLLSLRRCGGPLRASLLGGVARRPLLLGRRRRPAGTLGALEARRRRASDLHEFGRHPREVLEQLAARVPNRVGVALQRAQALLGLLVRPPGLLLGAA